MKDTLGIHRFAGKAQRKVLEQKQRVADLVAQHDSGLITDAELGGALASIGSAMFEAHNNDVIDVNTGLTIKGN